MLRLSVTDILRAFAPEKPTAALAAQRFSSETGAIEAAPLPYNVRATLHVLAGLLVLSMIIMGFLSVDRTVTAPGRIVTTEPMIVVQPLETSLIRSLEVKPGDAVRKGAVLATLDSTFTQADESTFREQSGALRAEVARLEAECDEKPFTTAPGVEPAHFTVQRAIFEQRARERTSQMASTREKIASLEAATKRASQDAAQLRDRLNVLEEVEHMRADLEKKQSGSRLLRLQATDARLEVERNLNAALNTERQVAHDLESARSDLLVYVEQWKSNVARDLVQKRKDLEAAEGDLQKASKRSQLVQLIAPQDASVLAMGKFSVGSVMTSGQTLMTLVPTKSTLEGELAIDAADFARVAVGDPVTVKLLAYDFIHYGTLQGRILALSDDSFTDNSDNRPVERAFYRARVNFETQKLRNAPENFTLVPGMPFTGDIKIGERTVLGYLFQGVLRNVKEGLRDP